MRIPNLIAISFLALTVSMLQGCGRKGPLFMQPPKPAPAAQLQTQPAQPLDIPVQSQAVPSPTMQNQPKPTK